MYRGFGAQDDIEQGDVVKNVLFTHISDLSAPRVYDIDGNLIEINLAVPLPEQRFILTPVQKSAGIILSQSCDCLSKPYICVARIKPLIEFDKPWAELVASQKDKSKQKADHIYEQYQRAGSRPDVYYLREEADFPKSVATFVELNIVPTINTDYLKRNRILRLTEEAALDLQFRLSFFFGRFATTAEYMLTDTEKTTRHPPERRAEAEAAAAVVPPAANQ